MDNLISVIVPVFNTEPYLDRCLSSLVKQSYGNIEIIAVDDGSTDGSMTVLKRLALLDSRVKTIHIEHGGVSAARNTGIDAASGDWLMFVDSDDYVEESFCAHSLENVIKNDAEIGIVSYRRISLTGEIEGPAIPIENNVLTREQIMRRLSCIGLEHYMWNKIFRKDIFDGIRFPVGEQWEDIAVLHLLLDRSRRVSLSDEQLYNYIRRPGTIMYSNTLRGIKWPYLQYKKQYLFFKAKYPMYADSMHPLLAALGLKYAIQLAARKDPFSVLNTEREFLQEIPSPKWFSWKKKTAFWLLRRSPHVFYLISWILYRKTAREDI